jgi:glyoxylase-like metal-dependent hydrolase (beta-lactamase superfamily II)
MKPLLYTGGFVQTNGYVISLADGTVCVIDAPSGITSWLEGRNLRASHLLLTHQHYDHVEDAAALQQAGARVHAWAPYSKLLTLEEFGRSWGMPIEVETFTVDDVLEGKDTLELPGIRFALAHVPGHALDAVNFHSAREELVFCGDTVFAGSIGRTDLPGGNHDLLISGISRHVLTLPPETRLFPGHGPDTTVQREAKSNPYLA